MIEALSQPDVLDFVSEHENADLTKLILARTQYPNIPVQLAAAQIQSRLKAKKKLPGWYAARGVLFPHGVSIEQCSSELTARYKARLIGGGTLADLTGGTGIDTYYLSQSFSHTTYIEQNEDLCALAEHNFRQLSAAIEVINLRAEQWLESLTHTYDWLYADPARRDNHNKKVFKIDDCEPNLIALQSSWLGKVKQGLLIKYSPLLDIAELLKSLPQVLEVHVLAVQNECKEVLVKMGVGTEPVSDVKIATVNFSTSGEQCFEFMWNEEAATIAPVAGLQDYLYEPNRAIMKAGAFKSVANRFELNKLHANSHLYTSDKCMVDFPGRVFRIHAVEQAQKKALKRILPEGKANLTTRNFPQSVDQLRKKLQIKEGGDKYIFATTLADHKPVLILCEKVKTPD